MSALCQERWLVTVATTSTVVSTAPPHCAPLPKEAMSSTASSSRLQKTRGQLATDPAPSASQVLTQPGRHSQMAYRRPGQFVMLAGTYQPEGDTLRIMDKQQLLKRLETVWTALKESYTGLSDAQLLEPGVMGDWSVKEILAHVTIWEEEALKYLPKVSNGEKPPRYVQYGGIDAFNAQMIEQKRSLALSEVLSQLDETHRRLINYLQSVSEEHFRGETRFRHRLRLDTYSHYPLHARAIQEWQERVLKSGKSSSR